MTQRVEDDAPMPTSMSSPLFFCGRCSARVVLWRKTPCQDSAEVVYTALVYLQYSGFSDAIFVIPRGLSSQQRTDAGVRYKVYLSWPG